MDTKEQTLKLLEKMPKVNSVSAYGSGFFKQAEDDYGEKKSMDLILTVDNPSLWHLNNYLENDGMYDSANIEKLIDVREIKNFFKKNEKFSFPDSMGCFFTQFEGKEYKCLVVDKRLAYHDLKRWSHFSIAGRFQKETELLIDNSDGVLPKLMEDNFNYALNVGRLLMIKDEYSLDTLFKAIAGLSYMGDLRTRFHFENKNKIPNLVNGSYDFFNKHYTNGLKIEDNIVYDDYSMNLIYELPASLKNYLIHTLSDKNLQSKEKVAKAIQEYFNHITFKNSVLLALRCNETVGKEKSRETFIGKAKKGLGIKSKVLKR